MDKIKDTAVCFAAHPDDLEFSCTGTLSKLVKDGMRVIYVIITNGENGYKKESPLPPAEERVVIRQKEQLRVAELLGVEDTIFLGYRDGFLEFSEELRRRLVEILKKYRPRIVFSFDPANRSFTSLNVLHRDHRIASEAVFDACFAAKNRLMYAGTPHRVEKMYFYASDRPNHFEDITDLIDFKLQLLACHKSQFPEFSRVEKYIREEVSSQSDRYKYSEAFRVMDVIQVS